MVTIAEAVLGAWKAKRAAAAAAPAKWGDRKVLRKTNMRQRILMLAQGKSDRKYRREGNCRRKAQGQVEL